jgi:hypothetical protein
MACTVMCKVERPDFPEDTNVYFAGDAGENLPSDLEAGASIWSKQDGDTSTLTLARCVKQQPSSTGNFTRHTLDLSIISAQGCTETTSFQSVVTVAGPSAELGLPCMQYREDNTMYPVDPP